VDACVAEGNELVVTTDGERRDADTVTPETFTSRDGIDTDDGVEEDALLENM
jgi:hypothetical protein